MLQVQAHRERVPRGRALAWAPGYLGADPALQFAGEATLARELNSCAKGDENAHLVEGNETILCETAATASQNDGDYQRDDQPHRQRGKGHSQAFPPRRFSLSIPSAKSERSNSCPGGARSQQRTHESLGSADSATRPGICTALPAAPTRHTSKRGSCSLTLLAFGFQVPRPFVHTLQPDALTGMFRNTPLAS